MTRSSEEMDALWNEYAQERSLETKNELVVNYIGLVKSIAYRMFPIYEGYSNYDDLVSCGVLGLIDAIEKYDITSEVKFEYYASMRIKGAILDYLRKQDWAPSSLRRKIKAVSQAYSELENRFSRTPTEQEVADFLSTDVDDIQKTVNKSHIFNIMYFEDLVANNVAQDSFLQDDEKTMDSRIEKQEMKETMGRIIDALPRNEKLVITLYYYEEMTMKEIAQALDVSESRISQIHSKVLLKLRSKVQSALFQ